MSEHTRIGLPSIMVMKPPPFKWCPLKKMNCNAYTLEPTCPGCPHKLKEETHP